MKVNINGSSINVLEILDPAKEGEEDNWPFSPLEISDSLYDRYHKARNDFLKVQDELWDFLQKKGTKKK